MGIYERLESQLSQALSCARRGNSIGMYDHIKTARDYASQLGKSVEDQISSIERSLHQAPVDDL